jgi:hypothetical protein
MIESKSLGTGQPSAPDAGVKAVMVCEPQHNPAGPSYVCELPDGILAAFKVKLSRGSAWRG